MKRQRIVLVFVSILLLCAIAVGLGGWVGDVNALDLMEGITPNEISVSDTADKNANVTDFAVRLFKACEQSGENTLISPLSVLCALAMTANGAKGETLAEMESVFGMSAEELKLYLYSYMKSLPQTEKAKLSLANSIWFTDDERFTVESDFLQTNADYFGADIYKTPFDDTTKRDINNWVKGMTDNMIPKILDTVPSDGIMYLVNALAFDAEWSTIYEKHQVRDGVFTKEDGTKQDVELMYGIEGCYLEDENASGFIKYYKGSDYAFVALLPDEGVSLSEYVASLDGNNLSELLASPQYVSVNAAIPKFETEYSTEMSEVLKTLGMDDAFDAEKADFSGLGRSTDGNIRISCVLHKTFITVSEKGTRAGAATAVGMTDGAVMIEKTVYLDRPFVYMLIDCENNIPFFIGTMTDVEK